MFEKFVSKLKEKQRQDEAENEITFKPYTAEEHETKAVAREEDTAKDQQGFMFSQKPDSNTEFKIVRPESFDEIIKIADHLLDGCTVILNVELMDKTSTKRMLDFLNGVTYALDGDIKKAYPGTYVITPSGGETPDEE